MVDAEGTGPASVLPAHVLSGTNCSTTKASHLMTYRYGLSREKERRRYG